ncbi:MAG: transporter substrate-binding domain-containing protein [Pseudomonadota bacterium]
MKLWSIVTGAVMAVGLATSAVAQSSLESVLESGVLRVGTTGDFNPMTVRDVASGSYKGFEIDVANALAEDLGVTVEFVPTEWKTMVAGVLSDKYDIVMSGTSISVGRAKVVGYTNPYIFVGTVPMTLKENADKFTSWEDANAEGIKVAVILGTVFEQQARAAFPNAEIVTVEAPATGFQEVLSGRADVTITSNVDAASIMERFDAITTFAPDEVRAQRPLAYITQQDNQSLLNFMNAWLALKSAGGFFDEMKAKWNL